MDDLNEEMKKYLVTIQYEWNEETMQLLPDHRTYINGLIEDLVIENYAVSMEVQTAWITINAHSKKEVHDVLSGSPFYKFWTLDIFELIVWDGQSYRLPAVQLN